VKRKRTAFGDGLRTCTYKREGFVRCETPLSNSGLIERDERLRIAFEDYV
jgi:hypothetical protein